jgi:hypothetical protein
VNLDLDTDARREPGTCANQLARVSSDINPCYQLYHIYLILCGHTTACDLLLKLQGRRLKSEFQGVEGLSELQRVAIIEK